MYEGKDYEDLSVREKLELNKQIRRDFCDYCMYGNPQNGCQWDRYKECTEYGKDYFNTKYNLKKSAGK